MTAMRLAVRAAIAASVVTSLAQAQTCSVPISTLTTDCGSSCSAGMACALKSASSCDVECFNSPGTFTFLVPFDATVGDTRSTPSKNNSELTKIAKLTLPSSTADVIIRGGSVVSGYTRNKVASVQFADGFLAANTKLQEVTIENFDLEANISAVVRSLPSSLTGIWLKNNLLTALPVEIASFLSLDTLVVTDNYITQMNQSHVVDVLRAMRLDKNRISSFTALFPKLSYLDLAYNRLTAVPPVLANYKQLKYLHLSGNSVSEFTKEFAHDTLHTLGLFGANLTKFEVSLPNLVVLYLNSNSFRVIPPAIFKFSKLQQLYLDENTEIKNVSLTNQQANFIATLKNFTIDEGAFNTDCATSQQTTIQGFSVCITGGAVDQSIIQGARLPASSSSSSLDEITDGDKKSGSSSNGGSTASGAGSSSNSTVAIILGCVGGVVAVALIAGFMFWRKKSKSDGIKSSNYETHYSSRTNGANGTGDSKTLNGGYTSLWSDPDLLAVKVNSDDIEDIKKIGKGAFCDVWLVRYRRTQMLASKRLKEVTRTRTQDFVEEIKIVASLSHPTIVQFVGAAWTKEADLEALFEFMERGDLRTFLEDDRNTRGWSLQKLQFALDIAEALVYVHSFNPPLVHRDLKSRNVLLNAEMQAKLTDFGVSRFRSEQNTMTAGVGTGRWLAPEVILGSRDYGAAADIFSFGVVLFELDTHKIPYEDVRGENGSKIADVAVLQLVSTGKLRPTFLSSCPEQILELAQMCLSLRPEDRPSAPEVAYSLRTYKKSISRLYG